jgi:hypothetical protein
MIRRHYRRWLVMASVLVLPLLWASGAQAISMIKVREIYPGNNNDSYVELQAFAEFIYAGDTLVGKSLILFEADGTPTLRFTFTEKNDLGASDTSFLIGDTGVQEHFGVTPDIVDPLMSIDPAGGAVCWNVGDTPVDCAAWGDFTGQAALQEYAGTGVGNPASPGGITPGKSLERLITPNCPTWLEAEDDTDDSATDFAEVNPNPIHEGDYDPAVSPCFSGMPEDTALVSKPANPSKSNSAQFTYTASTATTFQCKLDGATRYTTCPSNGQSYSSLADGSHTFLVRGLNSSGPDNSPAAYTWTVDTTPPEATILTHPGATSFGKRASFTFSSGESDTTYKCSLDSSPASGCQPAVTLQSLTGGTHTFNVTAVDAAGNVQAPPASYTWTVDANLPVTTIDTKPDNPTASSSVSFTYHANRPDTVFECSMDGTPFSSCPSDGANYSELAQGSHTFRVQAIDSDGDVEASPPSYSFVIGATARPRTCRKGFKKKVVNGTVRCVRIRHHIPHRR